MPRSYAFITLCFSLAISFPAAAPAQNTRLIVFSPRVGSVIDSAEAATFKLFQTLPRFHSASAYQAPDSSLLPLAPNTAGLVRPVFATIGLDISIGAMSSHLSELEPLSGRSSSVTFQGAVYFHVPLWEEPQIRFMSGWSSTMTGNESGNLTSFSAFIVCRPWNFRYFSPLAGIGAAQTSYGYRGDTVAVRASDLYPLFVLGVNLAPDIASLLITVPLERSLYTTFESKSYAIKPAGVGVHLVISL